MKRKHFILALAAMLLSFAPPIFAQVAKVGDAKYATLAEAISKAPAGGTVELMANVNEKVTISKSLTIDGVNFKYTGTMTVNKGLTVTVQNINFINGGIDKPSKQNSTTGTYTIKNCTFDGAGSYAYPIRMYGGNQINVENCTVKDYLYSFLYVVKSALNVSVKNVTVENCPNYAIYFASGVNNANIEGLTVKNANNGLIINNAANRSFTLKNCTMENVTTAIDYTGGTSAITCTALGVNDFGGAAMSEYANVVAAAQIGTKVYETLEAAAAVAQAGETVVLLQGTDAAVTLPAGVLLDKNGFDADNVVVTKPAVAKIGEQGYDTFAAAVAAAEDGQTITLVADAEESATVVLTKNLTIDGGGHTFTGAIEFKMANGYFTVKNVNFNGAGTRVYALKSQASTTSLKVEGCTVTGYTYGFLYANKAIANVTVTDVTVTDVTYGVHSAYGTNVTLNNFVAQNVEYGVMVQNYGTRKVVLNNCSFTGSENPLYIWERNQTNKITFNFQGVNEMGKADYCTSAMAVVNAEAVAGTKVCGTLAEAVAAAQAGEAVTLLRNAEPDNYLTIDKSITLNLGEYNITRDGTALYVNGDNAEVVINGTGTVTGSQALWVANGLAKVYGGNFCGGAEAVYVTNTGKAEIYGGTFSSSNYNSFVLNKKDANRETTSITVYGGTFVGFNPAENAAEGTGTNFVAPGYMAVANADGTYGVATANIKLNDSYYATLAEAIAAIGAGDNVIELLADATLDYNAREAYGTAETASVTINGNGHTLTLNQKNSDWSSFGLAAGKVAFNNMTIEKTGYGDTSGAWNTHAIIFSSPVEMTGVIINNGIAVQGGAILNNVTINEANGYYGLWINGNGQTVAVNGGAINATNGGRGIKIADQYIDAPQKVTLTVDGTEFATAKKAAVLVSSKAGAQIAASNFNIENVAEDKVNFVWVDEDWAPYFAEVEVTGATKAQEGIENFVAKRENGTIYKTLAEAIAAAQAGETITLIANIEESVTIAKNLTIDGANFKYTGVMTGNAGLTVTVKNVNFVNGGFAKTTKSSTGVYTFKSCTFDGAENTYPYALRIRGAKTVNVENCTAVDYMYGLLYVYSSTINLNVKDVTVENCPDYAIYLSSGVTNTTIERLTVKNSEDGIVVNNAAKRTLTIKDCVMENVTGKAIKHAGKDTDGNEYTYTITVKAQGANNFGGAAISEYVKFEGAVAQVGSSVYGDLNAAFAAAAKTGDTVTLLEDVELTDDDVITIDGMNTFCHVPTGKNITFDMNEKKITVSYNGGNYLYGVFLVDGGLIVTGNGEIDIPQTDRQVAYMFLKRGATGHLTIENGYFHAGNLEDSMIYTNGNDVVTVIGGTFVIDNVAERSNGCPWIFNTKGTGDNHVNVLGGTYNFNVSKQHYIHEVKLADGLAMTKTADGLWTVASAIAAVGGDRYATLAEAIEAAGADETVTLVADATGAGVVIDKDVTIDFGGHTYSFTEGVGSTGTPSNGFQILKNNDVTLMNGTLNVAAEAADKFYILVQNYANLTVEDMKLDGTNLDKWSLTDGDSYVLSNNSGEVVITGNTNITANNDGDKAFAFDACDKTAWGYTLPEVNIETTGKIAGLIESTATIAISSGTFTTPILPEWCAEYYVPVQNADGTWTVDYRYIDEMTIVDDDYTPFENLVEKTIGELTYKRTIPAADVWQSIYVPFEIPVEELTERGYDVAYYLDVHFEVVNGKINMDKAPEVHLILINEGTLKANFPYAIRAKSSKNADLNLELVLENAKLYSTAAENMNSVESGSTVNRFVFAGTYTRSIPSVLTGNDTTPCYAVTKKGEFKKMGVTAGLPPFRVYMSIIAKDGSPFISSSAPAESIRMRVIGEENENGETIIYDVENDVQGTDYIYDLHGRRVMEPQKGSIYIVNGKKIVF